MNDDFKKNTPKVGLVCVQFRFANKKDIPREIPWEPEEPPTKRKDSIKGAEAFEMTENVSLSCFLDEFENAGFVMVDAWCRQRQDPQSKKYHFVVRFMFAPEDQARCSEGFVVRRGALGVAFYKIGTAAFWRVRGYINPFFEDGKPVSGKYAASINLEGRVALFEPDGKPVVRWERDAGGNKIGAAALPLEPSGFLAVRDGQICLLVPTAVGA